MNAAAPALKPLERDQTWTGEVSLEHPVVVPAGRKLTLAAGCRVRINGKAIIVDGELVAEGTPEAPVELDGGAPGSAVMFRESGRGRLTRLSARGENFRGVLAYGASRVVVERSRFSDCPTGVWASDEASLEAADCEFNGLTLRGAVVEASGRARLLRCRFARCAFGVAVEGGALDAQACVFEECGVAAELAGARHHLRGAVLRRCEDGVIALAGTTLIERASIEGGQHGLSVSGGTVSWISGSVTDAQIGIFVLSGEVELAGLGCRGCRQGVRLEGGRTSVRQAAFLDAKVAICCAGRCLADLSDSLLQGAEVGVLAQEGQIHLGEGLRWKRCGERLRRLGAVVSVRAGEEARRRPSIADRLHARAEPTGAGPRALRALRAWLGPRDDAPAAGDDAAPPYAEMWRAWFSARAGLSGLAVTDPAPKGRVEWRLAEAAARELRRCHAAAVAAAGPAPAAAPSGWRVVPPSWSGRSPRELDARWSRLRRAMPDLSGAVIGGLERSYLILDDAAASSPRLEEQLLSALDLGRFWRGSPPLPLTRALWRAWQAAGYLESPVEFLSGLPPDGSGVFVESAGALVPGAVRSRWGDVPCAAPAAEVLAAGARRAAAALRTAWRTASRGGAEADGIRAFHFVTGRALGLRLMLERRVAASFFDLDALATLARRELPELGPAIDSLRPPAAPGDAESLRANEEPWRRLIGGLWA